jgi:hypothetical protein
MLRSMKPAFSEFCMALAIGLATATTLVAADPSPAPEKFRAHIGGFGGGDFVVEWRDQVLTYTSRARERGQPARTESIVPTPAQWREFRAALDELKVWQWKSEYTNPGIMDGTQWSLDVVYADHSLSSQGSNNFPKADGKPAGQPAPTKTFQRFLGAVKNLLGGREFE